MKRALLLALLLACGSSKQRELNLTRLSSPVAKQRADAVRALAGATDDDAWAALSRAVRDGSPAVRIEAAQALAAGKREDAPDAISPLLRDPDDGVRVAAAKALTAHCGERTGAYLRLAFSHSDAAVRAEIAQALQKCGIDPAQTLQHEESERRRRAMEQAGKPTAAVRAHGAHELGLLGRDEDRKQLLQLLDDRDGVVVAASARALGESGEASAAPRLVPLLDEGGEVAAAAAEALLALGPGALAQARDKLARVALASSDEAVPAAVALSADTGAPHDLLCRAALAARNPRAASLLAPGCPAGPFAQALAAGQPREPLFEALLRAGGPAPKLDATLSKLLRAGDTDARIPRIALRAGVAGPALLEALRRERAARALELQRKRQRPDDSDGSAAEIAKAPAPGVPDKERYTRLMGLLQEKAGVESAKTTAASRLDALLHGDAGSDRRAFMAGSLRAVLALKTPGAAKVAAAFAADPDPTIGAAARGEPEPAARARAEKRPPDPRIALWSDDGAVRAAACRSLDPSLAATRRLLAVADPERRVRGACAATNETDPRK